MKDHMTRTLEKIRCLSKPGLEWPSKQLGEQLATPFWRAQTEDAIADYHGRLPEVPTFLFTMPEAQ